MLIKTINNSTIDVFLGKGWDLWGRFKISRKDKNQIKCFQINGIKFSKNSIEQLEKLYNE